MATIAENLQTIQNIKQDIKTAIENKGVTVGDSSFTDYPTLINNIPQENTGGDITLTNIDITTNGTYTAPDGEGYKTINVDVPTGGGTGKIDVAATGIKFGHSTFAEIPDLYNFESATDMSYMFYNCKNITTISPIDTSNATNMERMFAYCSQLTTIPTLDTSNVSNMSHMFDGCTDKLQSIPNLNTSNVTTMNGMFSSCRKLQSIPNLNTSNVDNMSEMFAYCYELTTIPMLNCSNVTNMSYFLGYYNINTLTYLGGFKDLKISVTSDFLNRAPNLTLDSLMNVINNLYDLTANGLSGQSLKFGQTNLDKLTSEQIAVATAKGWTLLA